MTTESEQCNPTAITTSRNARSYRAQQGSTSPVMALGRRLARAPRRIGFTSAFTLDWCEEGPRHWRIVLRCPDCESLREGVFEQSVVETLDDELDRGASALLADLKRITHANMTDEIEFFVRALDADLIIPSDF
jgi:hypothetical protein